MILLSDTLIQEANYENFNTCLYIDKVYEFLRLRNLIPFNQKFYILPASVKN